MYHPTLLYFKEPLPPDTLRAQEINAADFGLPRLSAQILVTEEVEDSFPPVTV